MNIETFTGLASFSKWVPYKLVYDPKREKFDKIPHNGRHGLSTKAPANWMPLMDALEIAKGHGLSGIGYVMTGGTEVGDWTLLGFDFDGVDFKEFKLPFKTYHEKSPSKQGIRAFAWVPTTWANRFQDTLGAHPKHCGHAEFYFGTAPRFLTVTFDALCDDPIAELTGKDLLAIERWGVKTYEKTQPSPAIIEEIGTPLAMNYFNLTADQRMLVDGTGDLDRSAVLHGLLIKLIDGGAQTGSHEER
jgi:hypothetical protein